MSATFKGVSSVLRKKKVVYSENDKIDATMTYEGTEAALQSARPVIGTTIVVDTLSNSCTVRSTEIETAATGPFSRMTVTANNYSSGGTSTYDTIFELDFIRIEKDIRTHRMFGTGAYALTDAEIKQVDDYINGNTSITLSSAQQQLFKRLKRGQTAYPVWVPVARKSYYSLTRPSTGAVGSISSPPSGCGAPSATAAGKSYVYVLVSDKVSQVFGQPFRREQEWMGFDDADSAIYTNS